MLLLYNWLKLILDILINIYYNICQEFTVIPVRVRKDEIPVQAVITIDVYRNAARGNV